MALVSQSPDLVLMLLLHYEHILRILDHLMLMNALYMQYHLQHQNTHYHVHCPTLDRTLLLQNRQRAPVSHFLSYNIASTESGKSRLNFHFHRKMGTLFCLPNAFATSALMMALSILLVTMLLILLSNWDHVQHLDV